LMGRFKGKDVGSAASGLGGSGHPN
jgi:hypothetical protein